MGNGRLLREGPFSEIWIQPASGDAGGALGAALSAWHEYLGNKRACDEKNDSQSASLLGPKYSDEQIELALKEEGASYKNLDYSDIPDAAANLINEGNIIGWFQGRLEFGPRALGARSIIGDPRNPDMQQKMNLKIKYRESFRPFAPAVLNEAVSEWFELEKESPYMLLTAAVRENKRLKIQTTESAFTGLQKLSMKRSQIPAVTHVDYSARIQTVKRQDNPLFYDMINKFYKKTGCPVIINTSFNVRGEPLVCSPQDAFNCFMRTEMDFLIIGIFLLDKKDQKKPIADTAWRKVFELD